MERYDADEFLAQLDKEEIDKFMVKTDFKYIIMYLLNFLIFVLIIIFQNALFLMIVFPLVYFSIINELFESMRNCKTVAEEVVFFIKIQFYFISLEILSISVFFIWLYLMPNSPIQTFLLTATSSLNLFNLVITVPTLAISVISIISIYLYFFHVLSKTKFFSERTEVQERYSAVFWILPMFLIFGGFVILFMEVLSMNSLSKGRLAFDGILWCMGLINLLITMKIPVLLKDNFFNYIPNNPKFPKGDIYNYDFINSYSKLPIFSGESIISDMILSITILIAILATVFECNIILFLMSEFCLLVAHFWISQLQLIPHNKTTLVLKECDEFKNHITIPDLFILTESSKGYIVILNKVNKVKKIMKDSILETIVQKDEESPNFYSRWNLPL